MINQDTRFLRNSTLIPNDKLQEVTVIGLGGTGSAFVMGASIMGFKKISGYDSDIFLDHNLSTTLYPQQYIGDKKADIAWAVGRDYGLPESDFTPHHWREGDSLANCVVLALDNMEVRKQVYEQWVQNPDREWLVDMRMGALSAEIVVVTQEHDTYLDHWVPSNAIPDAICTAKHTVFTAMNTAALALSQIHKIVVDTAYFAYIWMGLDSMSIIGKELHVGNAVEESEGS